MEGLCVRTILYCFLFMVDRKWQSSGWCEEVTDRGFIRQPKAAYTSFFYYGTGVYMVLCGVYDWRRKARRVQLLRRHPAFSLLWGAANILHGAGVFWGHSSGTPLGSAVDAAFMRAVIGFPTFYFLYALMPRCGSCGRWDTFPIYLCLYVIFALINILGIFIYIPLLDYVVFLPFMVLNMAFGTLLYFVRDGRHCRTRPKEVRLHGKFLIATMVMLPIALAIWFPEYWFGLCLPGTTPYSFIQGHSLWHFLTAAVLFCAYLFMRTMGCTSAMYAVFGFHMPSLRHQRVGAAMDKVEAEQDDHLNPTRSELVSDENESERCGTEEVTVGPPRLVQPSLLEAGLTNKIEEDGDAGSGDEPRDPASPPGPE